jgi:hypothetical protein
MDQNRTCERVADNHFQALLSSGRDALDAARDMEERSAGHPLPGTRPIPGAHVRLKFLDLANSRVSFARYSIIEKTSDRLANQRFPVQAIGTNQEQA